MYSTFDNGYDDIKVHCIGVGRFKKGDRLPIEKTNLPLNCILATKYYFDEREDIDKFVYILIEYGKYVNWFDSISKIKGKYPIYEDTSPYGSKAKYGWEPVKISEYEIA